MIATQRPGTVYFNESSINLAKPLAVIRAAQLPGELRLVASGSRRRDAVERLCDHWEGERLDVSDEQYVDRCLAFAQRHGVDVLLPGRKATALAQHQERFTSAGIAVLSVASAEVLTALASKTTMYRSLAHLGVRIPDHIAVRNIYEYDAALTALAQHETLCYKPAVSIYGIGFKVLATTRAWRERLRRGNRLAIDPTRARAHWAAKGSFAELLVMQYLPGPERSVDCLAWRGELLRTVVRRKPLRAGRPQLIERHEEIEAAIRRMTAELGLHGVYNVQFRDDGGVPYLLEINPRMSGGLTHSCRAGVALPYWAIRLALGTAAPGDIPYPTAGLRVGARQVAPSFCEQAGP